MTDNKCPIFVGILFFLFAINIVHQKAYSQSTPEKFIKALVNHDENLREYVDTDELARSERLGISYTGVKDKFLIGFDVDEQVKSDLKEGKMQYEISLRNLENDFTSAEFSVPQLKYIKTFYFKSGKFISPSLYFTRSWQTKSSKYYNFRISEPKYFNDYCIKRLDDFVDKIADTLGYTTEEKELLASKKIDYIFCKDENEVKEMTGYAAKGQYILAFDEIISAYPTHFHELSHLLMNFKLKKLGLYTLPFFSEGFAVAMGGRGGMAPRVVTDVGFYLQKTGFLTYDSILTYDAFNSQDANMTYAVSGLYNMFLFSTLGAAKYLDLYKSFNGDLEYVKKMKNTDFTKNNNDNFDSFLNQYSMNKQVTFPRKEKLIQCLIGDRIGGFCFDDSTYIFYVRNYLDLIDNEGINEKEYLSRKHVEIVGEPSDQKTHYLIKSQEKEIKVFDLYNDELIFSYDAVFSLEPVEIMKIKGFFYFVLTKEVFGRNFKLHGFIGNKFK